MGGGLGLRSETWTDAKGFRTLLSSCFCFVCKERFLDSSFFCLSAVITLRGILRML